MVGELTLTLLRLGLLVLIWVFVFSVVGVLRGDLYGTRVRRRGGKVVGANAALAADKGRGLRRDRKGPTKLVVVEGTLTGTTLPLRPAGTLIGRSPECALILDDDYASGRHCRLWQDDDGSWMAEDLRSTNGTYLGANRLTEPHQVAVGSILRIGQTVLELQR